jgi:sucrose phosphorylase
MSLKNQVQLITYPDSLGGDLKILDVVLRSHIKDLFPGGIHILPPFPSSGDRGFAPLTYLKIDPKHGDWADIRRLGEDRPIMLDLMVNHISAKSEYFQDFLKKGRSSKYSDLFITLDKFWPDGKPLQADLDKIFLRRAEPFSEFQIQNTGEKVTVWTSFGKTTPSEQIDMDINSPIASELITEFMENFSKNKIKIVRLDAIGYVIKKRGTTCFFVEPEIYQYLDWISNLATSFGITILPEIHSEYAIQKALAAAGHWIYDFILPYLVLDALINQTGERLGQYLEDRPENQFTMLDCHDGVPVKPDLNGLYQSEDAKRVIDTCVRRGARLSKIISPAHMDPDGFDVHQIQGTYYELLGRDDNAYLAARALQFFTPGIPQVYYVGLLAGLNDEAAVKGSRDGRKLNRHNFTIEEIEQAVEKPVVKKLFELIDFRNTYPAFSGEFKVDESNGPLLTLSWKKGKFKASLSLDFTRSAAEINYFDPDEGTERVLALHDLN